MTITLVNPKGLPKVDAYQQVSVATGSKLVFVAGQVAWDEGGNTVGVGDLAAQVEQCYLNVATALAGVGSSFNEVAKLTVYVVNWTPDKLSLFEAGVVQASTKLKVTPASPVSLVGVAALDVPDHLVEVEAVAVID